MAQNDTKWGSDGQKGAKHLLSTFLRSEQGHSMPHAFLFLGPSGVGKKKLATEFVEKYFQVIDVKPEVLEYDFVESPSIENLRELISLTSLTSIGSKKVFILKNFHLASIGSINSLLKTLEEPSPSSMFVLISDQNTSLPTIMSRCIVVRCFPSSQSVSNLDLPKNLSSLLVGYPELAKQLIEMPGELDEISEHLERLKSRDLTLISKLSDFEPERLSLLIQLWIEYLKQNLESNLNLQNTITNLKVATQTKFDLSKSYNTKLVLQQFLLETKV